MIRYTFEFGTATRFECEVDEGADTSIEPAGHSFPAWLRLANHRCAHCSLPPDSRRTCPAALSIRPVIEACSDRKSFESVRVAVEYHDVKLDGSMTAQRALRSLVGLLLPLSSCPTLALLRPMAHFHLPYGGKEHTAYRFLGMYLVAQYLRQRERAPADWAAEGLRDILREVHTVNKNLAVRVRAATDDDATVNSLVFLDSFAHSVEMLVYDKTDWLRSLFGMYSGD